MITPTEFNELVKAPEPIIVAAPDPHYDKVRFMAEVNRAEKTAVANFRHGLNSGGAAPRKLRIKLDLFWDESLVADLVNEYRKNGWTKVSYTRNDYGWREPQGNWIVMIKM